MKVQRSVLWLGTVVAGLVVGAASYAFACTASATLEPLVPNEGARGTEVTVESKLWTSAANPEAAVGPVEIRWGSATGPLLATTEGSRWTAKVTVPDSPPNRYLIVAVSTSFDGEVIQQAKAFRLTGPAATASPLSGTGTTQSGTSPAPAGIASSATPAPSVETATPAASAPAPVSGSTPSAAPSAGAAPSTAAAPIGTQSAGPVASTRPLRAAASTPGAGNAAASAKAAPIASSASPAAPVSEAQPLPDPSKVWADTGTTEAARPSLVSATPAGGSGNGLAAALLVMGTLGLFATGFLVVASRRRVTAQSSTR